MDHFKMLNAYNFNN